MTAAEPGWLDLRVPFDDAAREHSLPLLDRATSVLCAEARRPLVVIDLGAGTGNSMHWFDRQLRGRLRGRPVRWVLVDSDAKSLEIAAGRCANPVTTVVAPISSLTEIAAEALIAVSGDTGNEEPGNDLSARERSSRACDLLITGSALLDVLTCDDLTAIVDALQRFSGVGIFVLSISGQWTLDPADPDDGLLGDVFDRHQGRDQRLGSQAPKVLEGEARGAGARTATSRSPWRLETPRDSEFLTRFLTERIEAVIEEEPGLSTRGRAWLDRRLDRTEGLNVTVDHTDLLIDATAIGAADGAAGPTSSAAGDLPAGGSPETDQPG